MLVRKISAWVMGTTLSLAFVAAGGCAGVATDPDEMEPAYVSPDEFRDLDCAALAREMRFIGARTVELHEHLEKRRRADLWQAGAALHTLGVSALYLDGDGPEAAEYRRLKGDFEALRIAAYVKDCGLEAPSPEAIMRRAEAASAPAADDADGEGVPPQSGPAEPR